MFEFKFPDIGEGITEGKIVKWLVRENDFVKKDQPIVEVETDKATVEIPAPVSGRVKKILNLEHDTVYVGKPFIFIEDDNDLKTVDVNIISDNTIVSNERVNEQKSVNEQKNFVGSDNRIVNNNYDASSINKFFHDEITPSKNDSQYKYIKALPSVRKIAKEKNIDLSLIKGSGPEGVILLSDIEKIINNDLLMNATSDAVNNLIDKTIQLNNNFKTQDSHINTQDSYSQVLASPSTRQLARDIGVDISQIKGTGMHGLITKEDVLKAKECIKTKEQLENSENKQIQENQKLIDTKPKEAIISNNLEDFIPLTTIRETISNRMLESWTNTVPITVSDEADVTELVDIREKNKEKYETMGIKLTYLPFFVKATVLSLQKNPKLNSVFDKKNSRIIYKYYYNIGIAVDTDQGLMVPNIKNCEQKNIIQIATEINDLALKCRNRTIKIDEMKNGTFTITNVGSLGIGQVFTQIINYPEEAILGIGRIIDKPVVKNGVIVVRKIVTLSCTADHRIIDGADVSRFLKTLIEYLENPSLMIMDLK